MVGLTVVLFTRRWLEDLDHILWSCVFTAYFGFYSLSFPGYRESIEVLHGELHPFSVYQIASLVDKMCL